MKFLIIICTAIVLQGCSDVDFINNDPPEPSDLNGGSYARKSNLYGTEWEQCLPASHGGMSHIISLKFSAQGKGTGLYFPAKGKECEKFSDKEQNDFLDVLKRNTGEESAEQYKKIFDGIELTFDFTIGKEIFQNTYELDMFIHNVNQTPLGNFFIEYQKEYIVYRISGDQLQVSTQCNRKMIAAANTGDYCDSHSEEVGTSASNRSKNLNASITAKRI